MHRDVDAAHDPGDALERRRARAEAQAELRNFSNLTFLRVDLGGVHAVQVRSERPVQVGLIGACLIQCHRLLDLPQEVVDPQLDARLVGNDDHLALGGSQAHAQGVGRLGLVRVDTGLVLDVEGVRTRVPAGGVSAAVVQRHRHHSTCRPPIGQPRLNTRFQQRGLHIQSGPCGGSHHLVVALQQRKERLVRLGQRRDQLLGIGGGCLHRHVDTQALQQRGETRGAGQLCLDSRGVPLIVFNGGLGHPEHRTQGVQHLVLALDFLAGRCLQQPGVQLEGRLGAHADHGVDLPHLRRADVPLELVEQGVALLYIVAVVRAHGLQLRGCEVLQPLAARVDECCVVLDAQTVVFDQGCQGQPTRLGMQRPGHRQGAPPHLGLDAQAVRQYITVEPAVVVGKHQGVAPQVFHLGQRALNVHAEEHVRRVVVHLDAQRDDLEALVHDVLQRTHLG